MPGTILNEAWADVKSPGDGFTYAVGTIEVEFATEPLSQYSGARVDLPPAPAQPFPLGLPRQVAIVQVTDAAGDIQSQAYFYGFTVQSLRANNARGISVFPGDTAAQTRVAICGETYDARIPGSTQDSNSRASATRPSGFIAVYDGNLTLLWSHQFFGSGEGDCAITDVSIRTGSQQFQVVQMVCLMASNTCSGWPYVATSALNITY